jgi:hypothetical protein
MYVFVPLKFSSQLNVPIQQLQLNSSDQQAHSISASSNKQKTQQSSFDHPKQLQLAKYIPLPLNARTSGRLFFYGWPVTLQWLQEQAPKNIQFPVFGIGPITEGLRYIREASGYKHAELVNGLVENDEKYEEQFQMGSDTVMRLVMLTVNLKNHGLWLRRPTEEQMEKLIRIFGGRRPGWYKDGRPKKQFWDYEIY